MSLVCMIASPICYLEGLPWIVVCTLAAALPGFCRKRGPRFIHSQTTFVVGLQQYLVSSNAQLTHYWSQKTGR